MVKKVIGASFVVLLMLVVASTAVRFAFAENAPTSPTGLQPEVVFGDYGPLSRNEMLASRILSPLNQARVSAQLTTGDKAMRDQPVDLAQEKFAVYVPAAPSPQTQTYGLIVFISPFPQATVPPRWIPTLDQYNMIFVTAANSGNEADVLNRRIPLALLGAQNIIRRYPDRLRSIALSPSVALRFRRLARRSAHRFELMAGPFSRCLAQRRQRSDRRRGESVAIRQSIA